MKNLFQRTITGALFLIILVSSLLFHPFLFAAIFGLIVLGGSLEFLRLSLKTPAIVQKFLTPALSLFIFGISYLIASDTLKTDALLIIIPFATMVYITELFRNKEEPIENIALTFLAAIYVAVPFSLLAFMAFDNHGNFSGNIILGLFIIIWVYDTGAYISGMIWGKHKMFPRVSPKKSWEGAIGGLLCALVASLLIHDFWHPFTVYHRLIIAVLTVIASTFGDLTESLFKRSVDIKDSGSILPGHGGILDRFDSVFLAVPVVYFYMYLFNLI